MFSSRSFIFSDLMFRSLIHFKFIFVYGVRKCSSFILLQVVDQFSQHYLLKRVSLIHTAMDTLSSTKEARIYNGLKTNLFNKWCWKTGQPLVKE